LLILVVVAYLWYTLLILLYDKKLFSHVTLLYKKFFHLFPFFVLLLGSYVLCIVMLAWVGTRYYTESFIGNSLVLSIVGLLGFLVLVQIFRIIYVKRVAKYS